MGRIFGFILIFAGWACLPLAAMSGLAASQLLGLNAVGEPFLDNVYGLSAATVAWVLVAAALLSAVPFALAMFAVKPHRSVNVMAAAMGVAGVVLVPDELGRAFGFPLLAGAAAIALGGRRLAIEAAANGAADGSQDSASVPTRIFDTVDLADGGRPKPTVPPAAPEPEAATAVAAAPSNRRKAAAKAAAETAVVATCQWCSAVLPAAVEKCPVCGVQLSPSDTIGSIAIPGVTEVSPALIAYAARTREAKKRPSLLRTMFSDTPVPQTIDAPPPSDAAALQPPSRELRAEMARLDAEIAAGASGASGAVGGGEEPAP